MPSIDEMVNDVLSKEGGYVNTPADKGGPTKFGITQATLSRFLERAATVDEVRNLDIGTARDIYELRYYRQPRIDKLPDPIQPFVFDCAVNHGPRRAIQFVQTVCNEAKLGPLSTDGLMRPKTKAVADACYASSRGNLDRHGGPRFRACTMDRRGLPTIVRLPFMHSSLNE